VVNAAYRLTAVARGIRNKNEKTLRFEKERWVFSFWEGFETSVIRILQPEIAFHAPARKVCRWTTNNDAPIP
jgi:hypothetical protein